MRYWIRRLWVEVHWLAESVGYWVRPYDMLADARRWRWQPAQRCGWSRFACGGRISGPSDRSDDRILAKLSDGHAWLPAAAVDLYGEDRLRRLLGVDHIHPTGGDE